MNIEELKQKISESEKSFLPFRECSMCKYMCGYVIFEGNVEYDNGCHCVTYSGMRPSSWDELFGTYETQCDEGRVKLLEKWGIA